MKIKGFKDIDGKLTCRGMKFEIGETYDTGAADDAIELCSSSVFHYCDSLQKVHGFYGCNNDSHRYCEIEVLGAEVSDGEKCGSNTIKIVREIVGEELDVFKGPINGNSGLFNSGDMNSGDRNSGYMNSGDMNSGDMNSGYRNSGYRNSGNMNSGDRNSGDRNSGDRNSGDRNSGYRNSGNMNSGDRNSGDRNSGYMNSGNMNSGNMNSGAFNKCDFSNGVFCTQTPDIMIFNQPSGMNLRDFYNSKYWDAMCSSNFPLTEWIWYTDEEKTVDAEKERKGGYLLERSYEEACAAWWENMSEENRDIIKDMPNFDAETFKEITGVDVESNE